MEHKQFKGDQLKFLQQLYFSKYSSTIVNGTFSDFENELQVSRGHSYVRKLFKYLIEQGAFIITNQIHSIKTYRIDKKKLLRVIEGQEVLKLYTKILDSTGIVLK